VGHGRRGSAIRAQWSRGQPHQSAEPAWHGVQRLLEVGKLVGQLVDFRVDLFDLLPQRG